MKSKYKLISMIILNLFTAYIFMHIFNTIRLTPWSYVIIIWLSGYMVGTYKRTP